MMAKLSKDEIQRIAILARLGLDDAELSAMMTQLSSILEFVNVLQNTDTSSVEATSQVTGLVDVLRDDEVKPCGISRDQLLANAPDTEKGFVKVKRVLE